ncbi:TIGR03086 family metal-binding protein [Krasilnikovia sp. M28-CT-15]
MLEADAAATRHSVEVVAEVAVADLARPTPCTGWDLRALLAHMTAQHRGFAAAAAGRGADEAAWRTADTDDPVRAYAAAAHEVIAAFTADGVPERDFFLPDLGRSVPGQIAIGFHLVDYVVHGWDVARTIGTAYRPPRAALDLALPIASAVPDGPARRAPGAAFGPGLRVPDDAETLDTILLLLGRDPAPARGPSGAGWQSPK